MSPTISIMASENLSLRKEENIKEETNLHYISIQNINSEKTKKINNFFCENCSLQFDNKYVFDLHLSLVHGKESEVKYEDKKNSLAELGFVQVERLWLPKLPWPHIKQKFTMAEIIKSLYNNFPN